MFPNSFKLCFLLDDYHLLDQLITTQINCSSLRKFQRSQESYSYSVRKIYLIPDDVTHIPVDFTHLYDIRNPAITAPIAICLMKPTRCILSPLIMSYISVSLCVFVCTLGIDTYLDLLFQFLALSVSRSVFRSLHDPIPHISEPVSCTSTLRPECSPKSTDQDDIDIFDNIQHSLNKCLLSTCYVSGISRCRGLSSKQNRPRCLPS